MQQAGGTAVDAAPRRDEAATAQAVRATATKRALAADFMRVTLFFGVVVAHSLSATGAAPEDYRSAQFVQTLLHMTRYGFVAVTLLVLVLSMRGRTMSPVQFWRRRFGLIVAPFLLWTLIYTVTDHLVRSHDPFPSVGGFFGELGRAVVLGTGKYQLYFLLISMQIYLFFPLIDRLLKRTANRPWWVLSAAAAIQVLVFAVYQWLPRPRGAAWDAVYEHAWKLLPMYTLFVAIGALAALHFDAVQAWLRAHVVPVALACVLGAAGSITAFFVVTDPGHVPYEATAPWNPTLLPWLVAATVGLWLLATGWDRLRLTCRNVGERAVSYATIRAFGVFAVHPLILDVLIRVGFVDLLVDWFPGSLTLRAVVLVAVVLTGALLAVDLFLRTPAAKWLVARDRIPLRPATSVAE